MRRPNPDVLPEVARAVWDTVRSSDGPELVLTACCTLMTPMYGGGVTPGKVDCELPIRASALRGQLRFWWRLLNGAGRKPAEVFSDESALWGGISGHGPRASQVTGGLRPIRSTTRTSDWWLGRASRTLPPTH